MNPPTCQQCGQPTIHVADVTVLGGTEAWYACSRCLVTVTSNSSNLWTPEPKPEPEPEPEVVPVIQGSLIGYRGWRIRDWHLAGTGVEEKWVPGVNVAACVNAGLQHLAMVAGGDLSRYGHVAPHLGCHCGLYALARFDDSTSWWTNADVVGAIEAWSDETVEVAQPGDVADATGVVPKDHEPEGRFILHGNGFRAQYGKVVLLAIDDDWPAAKKAAVRALAREHEADVCKHAHLEDAAKEHGQLVPDEMLEWAAEADPPTGRYDLKVLTWQMSLVNSAFATWGQSVNQVRSAMGLMALPTVSGSGYTRRGRQPKKQQGICQTLGHPGPPQGRITLYRKGQRVRDSKGEVWLCVKGGEPGIWEREE